MVTVLVVALAVAAPARAQSDRTASASVDRVDAGYVQSLRSIYKLPDASSETVGLLRPGDYVRVELVHSLLYRVFREGQSEPAGFVVYPKLGPDSPLDGTPVRVASGSDEGVDRGSGNTRLGAGTKMWVHAFVNIRSGPSTRDAVVAQLPPGSAVMVSGRKGRWHLVYKPDETVFEQARALGFVHESLLRNVPPPKEANPLNETDLNETDLTEIDVAGTKRTAANMTDTGQAEASSAKVTNVINVNSAGASELESLPRIGPVLAQRILDYRSEHGSFKRVEDLLRVKGIGDKTLERLRPYIVIE